MSNSIVLKRSLSIAIFLSLWTVLVNRTFAQDQLDVFLEAGVQDAEKLVQNYMQPLFTGLGYGMNKGWYYTAKTHKTLGFDLMVTVTGAAVPSREQYFTFNQSDYRNISLSNASQNRLPTLFGPYETGPELTISDGEEELLRISSPPGIGMRQAIGMNVVPVPMAQLGIGIYKGTDIKLRYTPKVNFGDGNFQILGGGVIHDIKQWLPGDKILPFDLAVMAGYTRITTNYFIDEQLGQELQLQNNSWTAQAMISKKLSVLTLYSGLGYAGFRSNFKMLGTYEMESETFVDPLTLGYGSGAPLAVFGLTLKFGPLVINGDYAISQFNMLTLGVGLAVR